MPLGYTTVTIGYQITMASHLLLAALSMLVFSIDLIRATQDFEFENNNIFNSLENELNELGSYRPHTRHRHHQPCTASIEERVNLADVVFTGTVRGVYRDFANPQGLKAQVEIKRIMKDEQNLIRKLPGIFPGGENYIWPWHQRIVMVNGIGSPKVCGNNRVRKFDTRIFLTKLRYEDESRRTGSLWLNSSLVRVSLHNLEMVEALSQGE